jgi:Predicted integral membrane protein (DUF2269)
MEYWKFLHIVAMFAAVSIFVGQGLLETAVARSGDVRALRRVLVVEDRFAPLGGAIFVLGIVFGLVAAIAGGFDLMQAWLVIGYVLAALILIVAFAYHVPASSRLKALAEASPDDVPSPELRAATRAPLVLVVNVLDVLLWVAVIFVMVVKPFS